MMPQANSGPFPLERRPSSFLSLAPTTSASYPTSPKSLSAVTGSAAQGQQTAQAAEADAAVAAGATTEVVPCPEEVAGLLEASRRPSSGSDSNSKRGFLRLGPVHFGEGDGDWSEDALSA